MKKKWFTLVEILLVVIISGSLFTTIYSVMTTLPKVKLFNDARMQLIEQSNEVMNRFAVLFQDYTIDYEEYFNRERVGKQLDPTGTYYENFSHYGNQTSVPSVNTGYHYVRYFDSNTPTLPANATKLSYGQYKAMFWNMGKDTDGQGKFNLINEQRDERFTNVGDADDKDLGTWSVAFSDAHPKELYLISHDGTRRLFLRRKQICKEATNPETCSYTIQMLKLRGFDAGSKHKFEAADSKTYDGEIDTRACDAGEGFICDGNNISKDLYPKYKLPFNVDDGWVNLFDKAISIENWYITLTPNKNPDYAWKEKEAQINPYIKMVMTTKLNASALPTIVKKMLKDYTFTLQTSFDTKSFYTR